MTCMDRSADGGLPGRARRSVETDSDQRASGTRRRSRNNKVETTLSCPRVQKMWRLLLRRLQLGREA